MPSVQIALLRGINVGKAKRVAMADLRGLVEKLGYRDVRTLLNSGNIVFTSPRTGPAQSATRIEKALASELGVTSRIIGLDAAALATIVAENSLLEVAADPARLLVAVPAEAADRKKLEPLLDEDWGREALAIGTRAAYLWCADGILASALAESVGRTLRDTATTRNWATILKLHALAGAPP